MPPEPQSLHLAPPRAPAFDTAAGCGDAPKRERRGAESNPRRPGALKAEADKAASTSSHADDRLQKNLSWRP